jgi:hypothetical protein
MFMPCSDEPLLAESAIVAFCAGLNTPVVNIDELEVGPARAGIMIAAGESSELNLLVRVCLISSGEGVTFKFQGDPAEFRDPAAAMDAALSFSEGMGFLFEEDLLAEGGPAGRQRAIKIWRSLCGLREEVKSEGLVEETPEPATPRHRSRSGSEIELTDAVSNVAPETPGDPIASGVGSSVLTKFRGRPSVARDALALGAERPSGQGTGDSQPRRGPKELGRLELASERTSNQGPSGSGFLTQLLSSFWVSN